MLSFLKEIFNEFFAENQENCERKDEPLPFVRKAYYGLIVTWYLVDETGAIAQIESGENPIPKIVFADESNYNKLNEYFENLPSITNSFLSPKKEAEKSHSLNGFALLLNEAVKGVYVFYEQERTNNYDLYAIPEKELKADSLPAEIQELLKPYHLELSFRETETLNI